MNSSWNDMTGEEFDTLATAALVGDEYLAIELERLGLSGPETSLREAKRWSQAICYAMYGIPPDDKVLAARIDRAREKRNEE